MIAHGAAVVRGSWHSLVVVDMPSGSYEQGPEQAFASAARVLAETGAAGAGWRAARRWRPPSNSLTRRGIPVIGHVGLTPQAVNALGGYGARGRSNAEHAQILDDARAIAAAGAFGMVVEGVVETLAREITAAVSCLVIGIGASAECDGRCW